VFRVSFTVGSTREATAANHRNRIASRLVHIISTNHEVGSVDLTSTPVVSSVIENGFSIINRLYF